MLDVLEYNEWSPIAPNGVPTRISEPNTNWLHFGAHGQPWTLRTAIGHARYHIETKEWQTIGYSALVVLVPRPMLLLGRVLRVGAHTLGYNVTGAGICVPGLVRKVPDKGIDAIAEALKIGASRGWWPGQFDGGHRDVANKPCPGDPLYTSIPEINRRARQDKSLPQPKGNEMILWFSSRGKRFALYEGSGRVIHLTPTADGALRNLKDKPYVEWLGEQPGLEEAAVRS